MPASTTKPGSYGVFGTKESSRGAGRHEEGWQLVDKSNTVHTSRSDFEITPESRDIHVQNDIHVRADERV